MAANVQVKPKIKQEEFSEDDSAKSSPKSPKSKPCSDCRTTTPKHLIETYVVATADGTNLSTATRKDLCGACLVGHDVAVFRASGGGWCFGEVKAYDISKLQQPFLISFLDGDEEWNDVSTMASSDYLNYIRMNDLPKGIVASFDVSSSSFSEMSSFDFSDGAVKPLFDESKLIHLDRTDSWSSFESFEENIFPDYGGNIEVMLTAMASAVNKPSSTTPTTYTPKKLPLEDNKVKTKRRLVGSLLPPIRIQRSLHQRLLLVRLELQSCGHLTRIEICKELLRSSNEMECHHVNGTRLLRTYEIGMASNAVRDTLIIYRQHSRKRRGVQKKMTFCSGLSSAWVTSGLKCQRCFEDGRTTARRTVSII